MKKILILGSSHAASLYLAKDTLARHTGFTVDWMVTPANLRFLVAPDTGKIGWPPAYANVPAYPNRQIKGGRGDGIYLPDYDVIFYSAVGIRPVGMLGWAHPAAALSQIPVSSGLQDAMIRNHATMHAHFENMRQFKAAGFTGQVICENWIRPCSLPADVNMQAWKRFCDGETAIVEQELARHDARAVGHLEGFEYLTPEDHVFAPDQHATHGNTTYAERMLDRLITAIKA